MFFQRFFARKKNLYKNHNNNYKRMHNYNDDIDTSSATRIQELQKTRQRQQNAYTSPKHRAATQLTPLWEHILRTRTMPEHICPSTIYAEFYERLRDPEWQVRQHALRVLVDVLVVMRQAADAYMQPLIPELVENLGHAAPTVRKGALDCLRVYLMETARPQKVLQHILDIGLNDCVTNEPYGGRLTCGVLLSIPALVQSTMQSEQRQQILESTINILLEKMQHLTDQEIILKVLYKLRQLIGEDEFREYLSTKAYRDLLLLTNMYNLNQQYERPYNWQTMQAERGSEILWRTSSTADEAQETLMEGTTLAKVIMETEIKINDDTLTMRLLEADENLSSAAENSEKCRENDVIYGSVAKPEKVYRIMNSYSDSEIEEVNLRRKSSSVRQSLTPIRTPKRVTFGGEIVKVRTPDSDATTTSVMNKSSKAKMDANKPSVSFSTINEQTGTEYTRNETVITSNESTSYNNNKVTALTASANNTSVLSVEIPNDNTKPLKPGLTNEEIKLSPIHISSTKRSPSNVTVSPRLSHKRLSISSVDSNISPKTPHKEIEVLHNLQRDPSPSRVKRLDILSPTTVFGESYTQPTQHEATQTGNNDRLEQTIAQSWEDLNIVDNDTLIQLKSGVSNTLY